MVKLKWLKEWKERKAGDVSNVAKKSAENFVSQGYAKYVKEPVKKKIKKEVKKVTKPNICVNKTEYENLLTKFSVCKKEIEEFVTWNCERLNKKTQDQLEDLGFEKGKRGLFMEKIKQNITFVDFNWKEKPKKKITKKKAKEILQEEFDSGIGISSFSFFSTFTKGKRKGQLKSFLVKDMADYILEENSFKVIKGNDKQMYFYENGYYKENGIALIKNIVTKILGSLFKEHYVNETISYIRNLNYIGADTIERKLINLKNGLLNPLTKEFLPHSPKFFCLNQLPIEYDKKAHCPLFIKELKKKCPISWKYDLIQEMFGYCLSEDDEYEKAFLLYGEKRTMKSTTLFVLENLLGLKNITSMSLQQITEDKHAPAFLLNSVANVCAELSPQELRNTNTFMKIVGRDSITAGKKFEQEITFRPQTKLIFSCNTIPSTTNKNLAFYRRWCVISFTIVTKIKNIDTKIRNKFLTELPGVLNWALEGLDRIEKNNGLSYPLSDEQTKDIYEKGSDSIQSFIFNCIDVEDDESSEIKRNVRKAYVEFCEKEKLDVVNEIMFGRRFIALTGCGTQKVGRLPGYAGIKLRDRVEVQKVI